MAFECQYCGKHLTRRYYLNCHLRRFHEDQLQSGGAINRFHTPQLEDGNGSCVGFDASKDEQSSVQVGGGRANRKDIFSDSESDSGAADADDDHTGSESSAMEQEEEEEDGDDESGSEENASRNDESDEEDDDRDAPFDTLLWRAYQKLPEGAGTKEFKKMFRKVFICFEIHRKQMMKSPSYLKIKDTIGEVRDRYDNFEYEEVVTEAVRLRRKLLDDMVPSVAEYEANFMTNEAGSETDEGEMS